MAINAHERRGWRMLVSCTTLRTFVVPVCALLAAPFAAEAQQAWLHRVGVIHPGGPYYAAIEGLRVELNKLGLEEGKQLLMEIRDSTGDLKVVEEAARHFEREKVGLIYSLPTSITKVVERSTRETPIVFCVGSDPVIAGLVESFAHPGGRLTGVHYLSTDLTAKRLELLKEMLPNLRRVLTLHNPDNRNAHDAAKLGREAARKLGVEWIERHVATVQEVRESLRALRAGEGDAFFALPDALVNSQSDLILATARARGLPTMFYEQSLVPRGGLAAYGVSFHDVGRMSAKYVQRILAGTNPRDLPVEGVYRLGLFLNLKTARVLGLTMPRSILSFADEVIQ